MSKSRSSVRWKPFISGALIGWLVGILWWAALMVAFGPSTVITNSGGSFEERKITVLSRLQYAPLVAIPWAAVGLFAGAISSAVRGPWVPAATGLGVIAGGAYSLATSPLDGWLAITMPLCCLTGAFIGSLIGACAGTAWQSLAGGTSDIEPDDTQDRS